METHVFMVHFNEPVANRWEQVCKNELAKKDVFVLAENTLLIRTKTYDPSYLTNIFNLDANASQPVVGAAFKLSGTYAGYHQDELWQWLRTCP